MRRCWHDHIHTRTAQRAHSAYDNQGLFDVVAMLDKRVDEVRESILALEKAETT